MRAHLNYLRYLLRHKWYVMLSCFREGLIWRGIKHDWSKLLPSEWGPYVQNFYGPVPSSEQEKRVRLEKFDMAWRLHQLRNDHHWQWWVLMEDSGNVRPLRMSLPATLEMLADWEGAGLAMGSKLTVAEWYMKNRMGMQLHPLTRRFVEVYLRIDPRLQWDTWIGGCDARVHSG